MEKVNEVIKDNLKEDSNFFSYLFNFEGDNKASILNMIQYTIIAIIPVIVVLKLIKHYVPEDDDTKPSIEILAEVVFQLVIIFLSIWFIDRIIRFIPTYSGVCYFKFNETNFIIPILIVLITMQTKLGAKINLLIDRLMELWTGKSSKVQSTQQNNVRIRQPLANSIVPSHQPSQADTLNNSYLQQQMPQNVNNTTLINDLPQVSQQQQIQVTNEVINPSPLMAANEALGGSFGSLF